jgi:hypothetical protein
MEGVVTQNFLKYLENIVLTKNILRVVQKAELLQMCHTVHEFLGHTLDLRGEDEFPSPD